MKLWSIPPVATEPTDKHANIGNNPTTCLTAMDKVNIQGVPGGMDKIRESVPYVKIYRYNPKHLYPKLNGYGENGHRKVWASGGSTFCTPSVTPYSSTAYARQRDIVMQ